MLFFVFLCYNLVIIKIGEMCVKKLLSFLVVGIVVFLPLSAKAARITGSCEKSTNCPDDVCQSVCTIKVTENTSAITEFEGDFVFTPEDGGEIVSITPGEGWTSLSGNDSHINFIATDSAGVSASEFTLATVTLNVDKDVTGCTLRLTNPSIGTEVTVEIEEPDSPNTGATLPIAILVCGVVAGAVIYGVSKKNNKLSKI